MKVIWYILLLGVWMSGCFVSCRSKDKVKEKRNETGELGQIRRVDYPYVTVDILNAPEYAYRDLIDSICYIPLGDECGVIGEIKNIISHKGRFYLQENRFDRIFIYDRSGKCLKKIDDKGRGPGEYLRVESIDIDKEREEFILVDGMSDKIFHYDLDGNFKYVHHIGSIQTQNSLWWRDSTYLHLMATFQNVKNNELSGSALLVSKGNKNLYKGFRYIPFQMGNRGGGEIFEGYNRVCYHPIYSDTIYQILSDTTYAPVYHFRLKNSSWEKYQHSDRYVHLDLDDVGLFSLLFETREFFIGYISDNKRSGYIQTVLYDRIQNKTYLLKWADYQYLKEVDSYEGYEMRGVCGDWFVNCVTYSYLESDNIFERVKDGSLKITDPQLEKIIKNFSTDSNPVLILTKFKHL